MGIQKNHQETRHKVIHTSYVPKQYSYGIPIAPKGFFSTYNTVRVHCPVIETHNELNAVIGLNFYSKTKHVKGIAKLVYDKF